MFTNNLRSAFYVLLGVQVLVLALAFSMESTGEPAFVTDLVANLEPWGVVLFGMWGVFFLVAAAAIARKGVLPKSEAVFALLVVMALGVAVAYLS